MRSELKFLARAGLLSGLIAAAGCSQETTRFNDTRDVTGSATPRPPGNIESQPLPSPQQSRYPDYTPPPGRHSQPNYSAAPNSVPAAPAPSYTPRETYTPASTGSAAPRPGETGWQWQGGTAVIVQPGENMDTLTRRYGVPAAAILRANNLADARHIQPGQRLVIPSYQANAASVPHTNVAIPPQKSAAAAAPAAAPARASHVHVVNRGETIYSIAKRYGITRDEITRANRLDSPSKLRIGQRLTIPAASATQSAQRGAPPAPPGRRAEAPAPNKQSAAIPAPPEKIAVAKEPDEPAPALGNSPQFRRPVQGRVISGFGPKPNGQHNDGINIAVPEGTEVKAAEGGVVAYSGNELKGYGNLVLIRHSDGWVTAYAHNSQLMVKRGEKVSRGQTIARAGSTGGVPQPQVHFEIRKGSTPVDPAQYLSSL